MVKINSKQNGSGEFEVALIIVVVGILGFVGWFVWHRHNTTTTLNIREWNVKLNISEPDAYYKVVGNGEYITISTKQLDELARTTEDSSCGGGYESIEVDKNLQEASGRGGYELQCARFVKAGQEDNVKKIATIIAHIRASLPANGSRVNK